MSRSSDANPVRTELGPQGNRKPLNLTNLPTIHIPATVGVVLAIKQESGGMTKLTLSEAERQGFITVLEQRENIMGTVTGTSIQIKNSRINIALFVKP